MKCSGLFTGCRANDIWRKFLNIIDLNPTPSPCSFYLSRFNISLSILLKEKEIEIDDETSILSSITKELLRLSYLSKKFEMIILRLKALKLIPRLKSLLWRFFSQICHITDHIGLFQKKIEDFLFWKSPFFE